MRHLGQARHLVEILAKEVMEAGQQLEVQEQSDRPKKVESFETFFRACAAVMDRDQANVASSHFSLLCVHSES